MKREIRTFSKNKELVSSRRAHIAECSARLFLQKGYEKSNMTEIINACGMSRGGLYHYIGAKEDILGLIMEASLKTIEEFIVISSIDSEDISVPEVLIRTIRLTLERGPNFQNSIIFMYSEMRSMNVHIRKQIANAEVNLIEAVQKLLDRGCATKEFQIHDTRLVAHNIVVFLEMWAVRRWFLAKHYTFEQYIKEQIEFIFRAIQADTNRKKG